MRGIRLHIGLLLLFVFCNQVDLSGQMFHSSYQKWSSARYYRGLYIGAGTGLIDMDGDYGSKQIGLPTLGYSLLMEGKFSSRWIFRGTVAKATLAERLSGRFSYMDFRSDIRSFDLSCSYVFSPLSSCTHRVQMRPYVNFGLGLLNFESYADLEDPFGNRYYFWSDGTIRSSTEDGNDADKVPIVKRDGIFETPIDSLDLVPTVVGILPFEAGVRFMFSSNFGAYLAARYTISTTDYIDHGVAYRDKFLTDRARLNHFPDGYYTYTVMLVYKFQDADKKPRYKKSLRKPVQCRKFR